MWSALADRLPRIRTPSVAIDWKNKDVSFAPHLGPDRRFGLRAAARHGVRQVGPVPPDAGTDLPLGNVDPAVEMGLEITEFLIHGAIRTRCFNRQRSR